MNLFRSEEHARRWPAFQARAEDGFIALADLAGFFGTDGKYSFEFETQIFKVPHLRNMYTKIGMFGSSPDQLQPGTIILQQGPAQDQVRGFGFQHDGSLGQLEHFFTAQVFLKATTPVTLADGTVVPPNPFGIPFVDPNGLASGNIVRREPGLLPGLRRWQVAQATVLQGEYPDPEPASLATRLFFGDEGVVRLDPSTGDRRVIVARRDRKED